MNAKAVLSAVLSSVLIFSSVLQAGPIPSVAHTVSLSDLKSEISGRNERRESDIQEVRFLLNSAKAHSLAHLFPLKKVVAALPSLDDKTLSYLAENSREANDRIRAGLLAQGQRRGDPVLVGGAKQKDKEKADAELSSGQGNVPTNFAKPERLKKDSSGRIWNASGGTLRSLRQ